MSKHDGRGECDERMETNEGGQRPDWPSSVHDDCYFSRKDAPTGIKCFTVKYIFYKSYIERHERVRRYRVLSWQKRCLLTMHTLYMWKRKASHGRHGSNADSEPIPSSGHRSQGAYLLGAWSALALLMLTRGTPPTHRVPRSIYTKSRKGSWRGQDGIKVRFEF